MKKLIVTIISLMAVFLCLTSFSFAEKAASGTKTAVSGVQQEVKAKKEILNGLFQQAESIRQQIETVREHARSHIESIRNEFKSLSKEDKAAKQGEYKSRLNKAEAIHKQICNERDKLRSLTDKMEEYRVQLKEAIAAKDFASASAILDRMIDTKTEKIGILQKILALFNELAAI